MCLNCFSFKHLSAQYQWAGCKMCQKKYNSLLHFEPKVLALAKKLKQPIRNCHLVRLSMCERFVQSRLIIINLYCYLQRLYVIEVVNHLVMCVSCWIQARRLMLFRMNLFVAKVSNNFCQLRR